MPTEYRYLSIGTGGRGIRRQGDPVADVKPELRISVGKTLNYATIPLTERDWLRISERCATVLGVIERARATAAEGD